MLLNYKELQQLKQQLLQLLQSKYEGITLSKKLQDWPGRILQGIFKRTGQTRN